MSTVEKINTPENFALPNLFSHAVKVPGLIFLSGQTPVDSDGKLVPGGFEEHTVCRTTSREETQLTSAQAQCIANLGSALKAAGSSWEKVVKVNVYLKNMDNFAAMNVIWEKLLPTPKPARTCIQAARLPNDVDVEIEAIAAA
ncbi:hypothetical protein EW146_g1492 [Bondarzewia mesenterica]|uniref:Uncharacterized protein n=1 Tax=Bondarzewia mesenterica TaxID=1095465 RepID=A0A4S4M555_9AGAM|nr:hypothetical protein EW146_g1492 [Bondarzewia mesenterica]